MKFLNTKEQVLDIQLTQYGKHLLSRGNFTPVYYAFFDDDILYDTKYAGFTETQNLSEGRIQEGTPRIETQYVFKGIETKIQNTNEMLARLDRQADPRSSDRTRMWIHNYAHREMEKTYRIQLGDDRNHVLANPLGTSSPKNAYVPAWSINFLESYLSSSSPYLTGSSLLDRPLNIPQLEVRPTFDVEFVRRADNEAYAEEDSELYFALPEVDVGDPALTLNIKKEAIVLEIVEENTTFETENFDIEIYEIDDSGNLVLLPFFVPPEGLGEDADEIEPDQSFVEYYLDIQTDKEIEPEILSSVKQHRNKNFLADKDFIRAQRAHENFKKDRQRRDIYRVKLGPEDFEEPCD